MQTVDHNKMQGLKPTELFKMSILPISHFTKAQSLELYTAIYVREGHGKCQLDGGDFLYQGPCLFFASPFQKLALTGKKNNQVEMLQFHGDFYCIEFHKADVACNGLLFNNAFLSPLVSMSLKEDKKIKQIWSDMFKENTSKEQDHSVLIAYLQLLLALASRIKRQQCQLETIHLVQEVLMEKFRRLIEEHFIKQHKPSFYAQTLNIPPNTLAKKCKKFFHKSPSDLIHERLIIEAKRRLHLTRQSIKEIAYELNFKDEYYFSRFFKKKVKLSPQAFRNAVGIARVADLSITIPS